MAEQRSCLFVNTSIAAADIFGVKGYKGGRLPLFMGLSDRFQRDSEENVSERFAALASNRVNVIDLNAYLKSFGAKRVFPEGILQTGNVKVSNGAFALMEGFDGKVFSTHPSAHEEYGWIYNPKQLDVWNLVFED